MTTHRKGTEHDPYVDFRLGTGTVVFSARVPHGRGERTVRVHVDPRTIVELGRLLDGAPADERGHLFYHWRMELPFPCSSCRHVPAGEPGVYSFKANFSMTGRWRLSLGAKVQGETGTVDNKLLITALK